MLELNMSPQIDQLATALAKAQGEMRNAQKNSVNPHFKSKYADLASALDAVREPLSKNGIALVQPPFVAADGSPGVRTMLIHSSGQWLYGDMVIKPDKTGPHAAGSAVSYARRYSAMAVVGIASDDDDANEAAHQGQAKQQEKPKEQKPVVAAATKVGKPNSENKEQTDVFWKNSPEQISWLEKQFTNKSIPSSEWPSNKELFRHGLSQAEVLELSKNLKPLSEREPNVL